MVFFSSGHAPTPLRMYSQLRWARLGANPERFDHQWSNGYFLSRAGLELGNFAAFALYGAVDTPDRLTICSGHTPNAFVDLRQCSGGAAAAFSSDEALRVPCAGPLQSCVEHSQRSASHRGWSLLSSRDVNTVLPHSCALLTAPSFRRTLFALRDQRGSAKTLPFVPGCLSALLWGL